MTSEPRGSASLEDEILRALDKSGSMKVRDLYAAVAAADPSLSRQVSARNFADMIWRLSRQGTLTLEESFQDSESFFAFLKLWDAHLSLYGCLGLSLVTVLSIYGLPPEMPWIAIRWAFGSVFVLFIPGRVAVEALFPKQRDMDTVQRLAYSVSLSLVFVMFVGSLLNYTPSGIRLDPIIVSLTLLTVGLVFTALARKYANR